MSRLRARVRRGIAGATTLALLMPGCATDPKTGAQFIAGVKVSDDPCAQTATVVGAVLGAIGGGIVANQVNHRKDTKAIGIAAGAAIGGLIGRDIDRRRCELFKISKKYNMDVAMVPIAVPSGQLPPPGTPSQPTGTATGQASAQATQDTASDSKVIGLSLIVRDSGQQFASGSHQLTPHAQSYFREVGEQYSYARQASRLRAAATKDERDAIESLRTKRVLLIGHTDDVGNSRGNADLSERRAVAVAKVFRDQGVPESLIFYQGAGETLPLADNRTEEGRAANRRVEIVDLSDDTAFQKYLATRTQRSDYYRPASRPSPDDLFAIVSGTPVEGSPITSRPRPANKSVQAKAATDLKTPTTTSPAAQQRMATATPGEGSNVTPAKTAAGSLAAFDFGGVPASTVTAAADFGNEIPTKSGFTLVPAAYASGAPVTPSCSTDRPRVANGVKSLRDQKEISITEYMPGLYGSSWMDTVNGNLVGLSHVAVYRDGGSPAAKPNLFVYRDYKPSSGAKPDYSAQPEVNTYRGDKAILYRVFVNGAVKCMDVVFPYDNSGNARASNLFYDRQDELYVASFKPRLAR